MQYSMELEFGMRYAEYGAVVIYVDPPYHSDPRTRVHATF